MQVYAKQGPPNTGGAEKWRQIASVRDRVLPTAHRKSSQKQKSEEEETENGGFPEETPFLGTKKEGGEDLLRLACDPLVLVPGGAEGVSLMIHTTHPHGLCLCASRSLKEFHAASLSACVGVCLNRH
jgi:hypothetical protein